jgi:hypothetical protein
MTASTATGLTAGGLFQDREAGAATGRKVGLAARSGAWRRFLNDLAIAMVMTDPISGGWYLAWMRDSANP